MSVVNGKLAQVSWQTGAGNVGDRTNVQRKPWITAEYRATASTRNARSSFLDVWNSFMKANPRVVRRE